MGKLVNLARKAETKLNSMTAREQAMGLALVGTAVVGTLLNIESYKAGNQNGYLEGLGEGIRSHHVYCQMAGEYMLISPDGTYLTVDGEDQQFTDLWNDCWNRPDNIPQEEHLKELKAELAS